MITVLRALLLLLPIDSVLFPAPSLAAAPIAIAQAKPQPDAWGCHKWEGLSHDHAQRITEIAAVAALQTNVITPSRAEPTSFWVYLPPAPNRAAAQRRVAELTQAGISDYFIIQAKGPEQFAISLGLFKTRQRANDLLESLRRKGIRDAQIGERGATTKADVELRGPVASVRAAVEKIALEVPEARGTPCPAG